MYLEAGIFLAAFHALAVVTEDCRNTEVGVQTVRFLILPVIRFIAISQCPNVNLYVLKPVPIHANPLT